MSSVNVNNGVLSPVDSFILEYRNKILEDQKKLREKSTTKNVQELGAGATSKEASSNVQASSLIKQKNPEPIPTILETDCSNKENLAKVDSNGNTASRKSAISVVGRNVRSDFMKDSNVDRILQDKNRITPTRDEEKQRFIDWLVNSPDITSPRDESNISRSRRTHTPDMLLPVNQRQIDIEHLQRLFSESPSYVPNVNNVNQFCESYVRADNPSASSPKINTAEDRQNGNELFANYVKTFESANVNVEQPMSITTNTFAHDQSCKKIIKIGEYSPLNPHFQPQPSVLDFSSPGYNEAPCPSRRPQAHCPHQAFSREKRDLESQMPSRKKSKAVQISNEGPSSSTCIDDDIEVVGTRVGSLPDIETKGGGDPMAAVKLKQELYKTELDKQIVEKKRQEEERRKREAEEDERAQRAYQEQQERLRREFEMEEQSKLQNAMQRQMREDLLKEKIRELQIQQEEEKARRRQEKEASLKRQANAYARDLCVRGPQVGNPSSIMLPNPFGSSRLDPISKAEPLTYAGTQGRYLAPPVSYHRGVSPQREVSPSRSLVDDSRLYSRSRDVSPLRPPVEIFRDVSPVRPLRETLPDSPSLEQKETIINNAPQELSMPLRRGTIVSRS